MNEYLTINEAAAVAKVSRRSIYFWIQCGKLKKYKLPSGMSRIKASDLIIEDKQEVCLTTSQVSET